MDELPKPPKLPGGRRHDEVFNPKKLFVGGLSKDTTQKQFREYWEKWGELEDCVVMVDPHTQKSRGFGFVVFNSQTTASDVLSRGESLTMHGRKLDIKKAVPRSNNKSRNDGDSIHCSESMRQAPPIYDSRMHPSRVPQYCNHYPPPYGSIHPSYNNTYTLPPHPHYHNVSRHYIPDTGIGYERDRGRDRDRGRRRKRDKLFVGGLAESFTNDTLLSYFKKYGPVEDVVVMFDKDGNSRRFGFVTFANPSHSDVVLNEAKHIINGVKVTIEKAIPKDQITDSASRRERRREMQKERERNRDGNRSYSPIQRYDDPYYDPYATHNHPPPPPPSHIYSPPPPPRTSYMHPPTHHTYITSGHPHTYLPPPPRPPAYYDYYTPVANTTQHTNIPTTVNTSNATHARYQYTYPPPTENVTQTQVSIGISKENTTEVKQTDNSVMGGNGREDSNKTMNVSGINGIGVSGQQVQTTTTQIQGQGQIAQTSERYNISAPVHTPTQYGVYNSSYSNSAYGAQRGAVSSTRTYNPY